MIVDFSAVPKGTKIILRNDARAPFPAGDLPDPNTTGQIMQFRVAASRCADPSKVPNNLRPNDPIVRLQNAPLTLTRTLTLNEVLGPGGPIGLFLDGKTYGAPVSEKPLEGTTELWEVVNLTGDTHPIHLHLVQFQILNRQRFDVPAYQQVYDAFNPIIPVPPGTPYFAPPVAPFFLLPAPNGAPQPPAPNENGWKDTVRMNPGEVTRILARFAPQDTPANRVDGQYPFSPGDGPGYVWHCHILEHEDNEMMRPLRVRSLP